MTTGISLRWLVVCALLTGCGGSGGNSPATGGMGGRGMGGTGAGGSGGAIVDASGPGGGPDSP